MQLMLKESLSYNLSIYTIFILGLGLRCLASPSKNIHVMSWRSVLLVEETVPRENHQPTKNFITYTSPERDSNTFIP